MSDIPQILDAASWDIRTKRITRKWIKDNLTIDKTNGVNSRGWKPVLIRTNFDSFFKFLNEEAKKGDASKICNNQNEGSVIANIQETKEKIEKSDAFNFLKNSSIWMRLCDNKDWDGTFDSDSQPESVTRALKEFKWFNEKLHLYEFQAAREYIEYNVRLQNENYLDEFGSHGSYITPTIYSDEASLRDFFIYDGSKLSSFDFLGKEKKQNDFHSNKIPMRILVIDDKIGKKKNDENVISESRIICEDCSRCKVYKDAQKENKEPCKLNVIRKLLSGKFIASIEQNKFRNNTYWSNNVKAFCVDRVTISDVWQTESNNPSKLKINDTWVKNWNTFINCESDCVQLIGVRDLESALVLMSCCKFDIILLDYLLGKRQGNQRGREYGTELFEFMNYEFVGNCQDAPDIVKMLQISVIPQGGGDEQNSFVFLKEFRNKVRFNRGPIDKYWIVPMTSYNPSFISDLQRRNVSLIDYRWNISQGADPINTPWKFLHKINEFVDLQLRQSVFWKSQLLTFLQYTCRDFKEQLSDNDNVDSCFNAFQSFMGAEYATFMRLYGGRRDVERDAIIGGEKSNKSFFSTYITQSFYDKSEYSIENELNRLMQRFYYTASSMFNESESRNEFLNALEHLCVFIEYTNLYDSIKDQKMLREGLQFLRKIIDGRFEKRRILET